MTVSASTVQLLDMISSAALLPDPGGEVVLGLIAELVLERRTLRMATDHLREAANARCSCSSQQSIEDPFCDVCRVWYAWCCAMKDCGYFVPQTEQVVWDRVADIEAWAAGRTRKEEVEAEDEA